MFGKFANYTHIDLMLPCSANYNVIDLRNIFLSGIYLHALDYIFPML